MKNLTSVLVERSLTEFRDGNHEALQSLFESALRRLKRLAVQMFLSFPSLSSKIEADDILQDSVPRLMRAMHDENVGARMVSAADFFSLAACQMRRVLLDLCRKYANAPDLIAFAREGSTIQKGSPEPIDPWETGASSIELWSRFHEAVEQLTSPQRETFEMIYYHELTYAETAELLPQQPSEKTVRRWFRSAIQQIESACNGQLPIFDS